MGIYKYISLGGFMKKFRNLISGLYENKSYLREKYNLNEKYKGVDSKKKRRDGQPKIKRCNCDKCKNGRKCRMNLSETISSEDGDWVIRSKKGKRLGSYGTKEKALKRLRQIEWFKRHG